MRLFSSIQEYMGALRARGCSPHTARGVRTDLETFARFAGDRRLVELSPATLDEYAVWLREHPSPRTGQPLSDYTIRKRLSTVKAFFELLVLRGRIEVNPARHLSWRVGEVDLEEKTIPLADLRATLAAVWASHQNRARNLFILIALADSGMRRGELAGLRLQDVDLAGRTVRLRRTKTRKRQRVPVSPLFAWAYTEWLAVRPAVAHDSVLCSAKAPHGPYTAEALGQLVRNVTARACGRAWGSHSFRHAWLSEALNTAGIPATVAQLVAGHSRFGMTAGYVRPDLEAARRAVDSAPLLASTLPADVLAAAHYVEPEGTEITIDVDAEWATFVVW